MSERRGGGPPAPIVTHAIGCAACAAALGLWYVGLVAPLIGSSTEARRARARLVELETERAAALRERNELVASLREREAELAASSRRLLPLSSLNVRIAEVAALAEEHAVSISGLGPGSPTDSPLAARVPIGIDGSCTSADAVRFMSVLHERFPDIAIVGFVVAGPSEGRADSSVHVDLLWFAERSAAPATASAPTP